VPVFQAPQRKRQVAAGAVLRRLGRALLPVLALGLLALLPARAADELPEYRLKAAFVYNFLVYTEWPADGSGSFALCIHGPDPFGKEIDALQGKDVGGRSVVVQRRAIGEALKGCHAVFIAATAIEGLPRVLEALRRQHTLTIADSVGAARQGVALNMAVSQNRVSFEANLQAARQSGLTLSSKLLRLATEVIQ